LEHTVLARQICRDQKLRPHLVATFSQAVGYGDVIERAVDRPGVGWPRVACGAFGVKIIPGREVWVDRGLDGRTRISNPLEFVLIEAFLARQAILGRRVAEVAYRHLDVTVVVRGDDPLESDRLARSKGVEDIARV
jgi:hypothetical protein